MHSRSTNTVFLLLGTNLGDRFHHLLVAQEQIGITAGEIIATSSIYETSAWGQTNQPSFLNQVLKIDSSLSPEALLTELLKIETNMGRTREIKWGPRIIDIDILLFDQIIIQSERLSIPHPAMHLRRFTLTPLAELAPGFIHPVFQKSIAELLRDCEDPLVVEKVIN